MFKHVRVGDVVTRDLGGGRHLTGGVRQHLRVTAVDDELIHCGSWTFRRDTGGEVDADLGWDGREIAGSWLIGRVVFP